MKQKDNATGCEGSAATWIYTVNDLPAVPAFSGASVCKSDPAPAVPSASGRYAFLWYDENDQSINEPTLQSATAETITYYIRQKDNVTGCTGASATWTYVVHDLPDVKISSATPYFCEKSSVELAASGASSYKWNTGATSASLTVSAAGTYSVTGTDRNGCKNTGRVEISEKPLPYAASSLPADTTVCHGTTLTFNALPGAIGAVTWNVPSPATIDKSQYLIVTATNACGSFSDSTRVTHTPLPGNPALSASHSQSSTASFCHSEQDTLTVQSAGATIFEWYKNDQRIPGISGSTLTVMNPGTYHAKARTDNFCYAVNPSNAIEVTVHKLPGAPALPNMSTCKNEIPAAPAAPNGYTYLWYDKNHKPVGHPALQSGTIETTTYYVKQKDNATGCEGSAATWIYTVHDLPGITISGTPWFCTNSHTKLTAAGAVDYLWNTGAASASVSINAVDTYSVTGTDRNGCKNTAQITVSERPLPAVVANNDTTVCYEREVTLGTRHHIGALRWNSPLVVKVTGPQTYTVTASNECGTASDEMTVDIFAPIRFTVPSPLPPYTHRGFYEQELSFENAERPVYLRWLGSLPDGMTITPDGILRGTPMTTGYNFNSHRFTLFLEDYRGCAAAQEFLLPARFSAPNTIIRDGGENSHFLHDFEVEIYRRQGILLHKGKGWLGTSGSSQVPPGTYFYKVNVMQDGEQHQHMGYVTVLQ